MVKLSSGKTFVVIVRNSCSPENSCSSMLADSYCQSTRL